MGKNNNIESNNKNNTEKNEVKTLKIITVILSMLVIVLIGISVVSIVKLSKFTEQKKEEAEIIDTVTDEESGMEATLSEKSMSNKEITETSTTLLNTLDYIKTHNGYIQCKTGEADEDYITYMYNKKGEIFKQNQNEFTVFRNNGTCIIFNDYATVTKDADAISIAEEVLKLVQNNEKGVEFKSVVTKSNNIGAEISNEDLGYKAYVAIISGYDSFMKIYDYLDDEQYKSEMLNEMKEAYGEDWEPKFKFYYTISNDSTIDPETNTYPDFSFSSRIVYDDEEYTQWSVQGYLLLNDWQLSENWYTNKFEKEEEIIPLIQELSNDIETMINEYAEENNIDVNTLLQEESTEEIIEENTESLEKSEVEHTINDNGEDVYTYSGEIELEPYTGDLSEVQRANE